jgi:fermentation-respiration switch protein FrsA (DUF1100 family)
MFPLVPTGLLMHNRFDSLSKIGEVTCPVFLAHGTADRKIPASHSERLYEAANEPKQYFPMPGVGHNDIPMTDECFEALQKFLDAGRSFP